MTTTPGYKTTEFWLTVLAAIVGLLAASGVIGEGSTLATVFGFMQSALATLGYSVARGVTKSGAVRAAAHIEAARITSGEYIPPPPAPPVITTAPSRGP